jgi:UDP-N-acetylmuramyl pentapeptide phosphotransferase/UDP-N-acetylglucosamine-1-phosphate transferase
VTATVAVLTFVTAAGVSFVLVEAVRRWSVRNARFDAINERSSHSVPTPRGGGIAITVLSIGGFAAMAPVTGASDFKRVVTFAVSAALVGIVSLIDDLRSLPAKVRFAVHALAAAIMIAACGYVSDIALGGANLHLGVAGLPLTLFWIVGLTNAYNFMDGIDGIAGGQAVIAAAGWVALGALLGDGGPATLALLLCATSAGFLAHNWPPARIFMGDVGSAFLGFSFAVLPLLARNGPSTTIVPAALLVWPFLFDATVTIIRRLRRRENVFAAHRSHLYQRLTIAGYRHVAVSTLYVALAAMGAVAAALLQNAPPPRVQATALTGIGLAALCLWRFVIRVERAAR